MSESLYYPTDSAVESLKVPPHSIAAEQAVLGALLLDSSAWDKIADLVVPSDFYYKNHQLIFGAVATLVQYQTPVDVVTLSEALDKNPATKNLGGMGSNLAYIGMLARDTPTAANVEAYAAIVREKSILRQLIQIGTKIVDSVFNHEGQNARELLNTAEVAVLKIGEQAHREGGFRHIKPLLHEAQDKIESRFEQDGAITGVATGFADFDEKTSGLQPADLIIIAGRPSMGKCFGKGTRLLMYSGELKPVEEIQVGDLLMGNDSTPRTVLSLARGQEAMYWVRQNKALDYRVNESHILSLKRSRTEGKHKNGEVLNIALTDYLTASAKFKNNYKGYKVAIEFAEQTLPLCPYFLGLWLGDGSSASVDISTTDKEIVDYLKDYAQQLNLHLTEKFSKDKHGKDKCPLYAISSQKQGNHQNHFSLQKILRELNLLNNKHIPQPFLINSRSNRLKLLAGLMDSDGHYAAQYKVYEITQKNFNLASQIKFLCDSLGFRTSFIAKQAQIKKTGYECTVYRVRFSGNLNEIPVKIPRKKAAIWTCYRTWQQTGISIEYDKIDDYYGFICDGNHLFLLEDMTVVHNTAIAMNIAEHVAVKGGTKPVAVFSMEMPGEALAMRMMSSLGRIDQLKVRTGKLEDDEWPRMTSAVNILAATGLFIDDTPALTLTELRARARRLSREHGHLGLIVIDYLQLMQSPTSGPNRVQQVSDISRGLKALAKELYVPVVALSQLNRSLEQRPNKRPIMSDLRESGCLTGDSLVVCATTGQSYPIKELVGRTDFKVWAFNEQTLKLEAAPLSKAFATGIKPVFRLTTQLGRTIRATANHKFYSHHGWQRLDELEVGHYLAVPRVLPEPTEPQSENTLTDAECALLGHLIGDGCTLPRHAIQYTTREWDLAELVAQLAKDIFANEIEPRIKKERTWYQVYLTSTRQHTHGVRNAISEWLDKLGVFGLRSYEKRVPMALFEQSNEAIAIFLRHLWVTDGCIKLVKGKKPMPAIYYASSSYRLCVAVQSLLLRLGINAKLKRISQGTKGRDQYHVILRGQPDIFGFINKIGTVGEYKTKSLAEIVEFSKDKIHKTNRDIIPNNLWANEVKQSLKNLGISHREWHQKINNTYAGITIFKQNLSRERAYRIAQASHCEKLSLLAQSDIYWDKIVAIELEGEEEVFDLTIPTFHNFIVNNIVSHNSIEQDADLIAFVYRDEVYDENSPDKGIAELIIGKQRNGPLGTVRLTFLGQFTRFENFAGNAYSSEDY